MLHRFQRTPELRIARFLAASICLSAFAALPLPQFVVLTIGHGSESEGPVERGRETAKEDVVLNVTVRRRSMTARISRHYKSAGMPRKSSSTARPISAIVGHQFANVFAGLFEALLHFVVFTPLFDRVCPIDQFLVVKFKYHSYEHG